MKIEKKVIFNVGEKLFKEEVKADIYLSNLKYIKERKCYLIHVNPDISKKSGYKDTFMLVIPSFASENVVYQFLMNNYGKPLTRIKGARKATYPSYLTTKLEFDKLSDLASYLEKEEKLDIVVVNASGEAIESIDL